MKLRPCSFFLPIVLGLGFASVVACRPAEAPPPGAGDDGSAAPAAAADAGESPDGAPEEPHSAAAESAQHVEADGGAETLATVLVTDPAEVQKIFEAATSAPKAGTKANGAAGTGPLAKGLREFAKSAATGMKADGPLFTGKLEEKKNLQAHVTLKPGRCYAVVGYSDKVTDLDLYLFLPPGILSGQDTTDDNKPVIGKVPDAMCPVAKSAVKYTLDIVADQGAGEVVVQVYSRSKASKKAK
jgi:hypothetical protein